MGRYECGVRHGIGQQVMIEPDIDNVELERYKIIPKVYNNGNLVRNEHEDKNMLIVTDILSNIDFFGFMGLIEQQDDEMEANIQLRKKLASISELTLRINLEVKDIDFPEEISSLWNGPLD